MPENMTQIVKFDPELIKKARSLAGTSAKLNKTSYVKISYDEDMAPRGQFILKLWNGETESYTDHVLGISFPAVILAHTKQCSQWDNDLGKNLYDSTEFDTYKEQVTLLSDGEPKDQGTYRELKTKYPDLKLQIVLYLYMPEKGFFKMYLKSGTIVDFGKYENSMVEMGGALQAFATVFSTKKEKNGSVTYFKIKFAQGEYVDFPKMVELSEKVRSEINGSRQVTASRIQVKVIEKTFTPELQTSVTESIGQLTDPTDDLPF